MCHVSQNRVFPEASSVEDSCTFLLSLGRIVSANFLDPSKKLLREVATVSFAS